MQRIRSWIDRIFGSRSRPLLRTRSGKTVRLPKGEFSYVYGVRVGGQMQNVLSVLPPEDVMRQGIPWQSILGWLVKSPKEGGTIAPENFIPNERFARFLCNVVARHGPASPSLRRAAKEQGKGGVVLLDARTPDPEGDLSGLGEDIIGYFIVENGEISSTSYRHNAGHRLVSDRGVMKLDSFLNRRLLDELRKLPPASEESPGAGAAE